MTRYFLTFAYDGTHFQGWQIQPNGRTIQGELQHAISTILRTPIEIVGAGRTDSGVHAQKMVAHLELPDAVDAQELAFRLNRFLTHEIAILGIAPVIPDAHARFGATSRTYHYQVTLEESPFLQQYHLFLGNQPNFQAMNEAARHLLGEHDFTTFSKTGTDVHTHLCTVTTAEWQEVAPHQWTFVYTANRFLRNMVRATVGTLLDVGRGKMSPTDFLHALQAQDRARASSSTPAHPLFLHDITYPSHLFL